MTTVKYHAEAQAKYNSQRATPFPTYRHYDVIHINTGSRVGSISLKIPGWFFISNVASHGNSLKGHATPEKAMPIWTKNMGCRMEARN